MCVSQTHAAPRRHSGTPQPPSFFPCPPEKAPPVSLLILHYLYYVTYTTLLILCYWEGPVGGTGRRPMGIS